MMQGEGKGTGFRKVILINEHFVVYGVPAIAVPVRIPVEVRVSVRAGSGLRVRMAGIRGAGRSEPGDTDRVEALKRVAAAMGVTGREAAIDVECIDDLPGWSGLGSSAGLCVAFARALCDALGWSLPDDQINRAAYEGERVFADNPSGIDNTVATYGRTVWYQRDGVPPWEWVHVGLPLWLVIGNSGLPSKTRHQVGKVACFKEARPARFEGLAREARRLAREVRAALEEGDLVRLGRAMDLGHALLQQIGVSHERLDEMVEFCRARGALGSKLTGAGGGGCMVALVDGRASGEEVAKGLGELGYRAISVQGVDAEGSP